MTLTILFLSLWARAEFRVLDYSDVRVFPESAAQALDDQLVIRVPKNIKNRTLTIPVFYVENASANVKGNLHRFGHNPPSSLDDGSISPRIFTSISILYLAKVVDGKLTELDGNCGDREAYKKGPGQFLVYADTVWDKEATPWAPTSLSTFFVEKEGRFGPLSKKLNIKMGAETVEVPQKYIDEFKKCRQQMKGEDLIIPSICDDPVEVVQNMSEVAEAFRGPFSTKKEIGKGSFLCRVQSRAERVLIFLPEESGKQYWVAKKAIGEARKESRYSPLPEPVRPNQVGPHAYLSVKTVLKLNRTDKRTESGRYREEKKPRSQIHSYHLLCPREIVEHKPSDGKFVSQCLVTDPLWRAYEEESYWSVEPFLVSKPRVSILGWGYGNRKLNWQYFLEVNSHANGTGIYLVDETDRQRLRWFPKDEIPDLSVENMISIERDLDQDGLMDLVLDFSQIEAQSVPEVFLSSLRGKQMLGYSGKDRCSNTQACGALGMCILESDDSAGDPVCEMDVFQPRYKNSPRIQRTLAGDFKKSIAAVRILPLKPKGYSSYDIKKKMERSYNPFRLASCRWDHLAAFDEACRDKAPIFGLESAEASLCDRLSAHHIILGKTESRNSEWIGLKAFGEQIWDTKQIQASALQSKSWAQVLLKGKKLAVATKNTNLKKPATSFYVLSFETGGDTFVSSIVEVKAEKIVAETQIQGEARIIGDLDGDGQPEVLSEVLRNGKVVHEYRSLPGGLLFDHTDCER